MDNITLYHYDQMGRLISETTQAGQAIKDYVYNGMFPVAQIDVGRADAAAGITDTTETVSYLYSDHLMTTRLASDQSQAIIWRWQGEAFGNTPAIELATIRINLRFPGQYYDSETNLHYNHYRYYDPSLGRYITSDPIGLQGGMNTYGYVDGNPLISFDPLGLRGSYCQRPLGDYSGLNGGGPLLFNHQFICVTLADGTVRCDSNNNPDSDKNSITPAPGEPSRPDRDNESTAQCDNIDDDTDRCFEDCVLNQWAQPRPNYAIGPLGTDCQEYSRDIVLTCRAQCRY